MEKLIIAIIIVAALVLATIKFTSVFKYLGLNSFEAISISILTSTFILVIIGKVMISYLGFPPFLF